MSFDLWVPNKYRRTKMNVDTLDKIVDKSFYVEEKVVLGNEWAKKSLRDCLPLERNQFVDIAKDEKSDFVKGYDDKFPRIDMKIVENSTKMMDGVPTPAFAIYNVFTTNNEYTKTYQIDSCNKYETYSELSKKLVPHNPLKMKFYNHLWRTWARDAADPFIFFGICLQLCWFSLLSDSFILKSILIPLAALGIVGFIYGLFIAARASNSLAISRTFSHKFSGIIPDNVRELIKNEQINFERIYLIEEGYNWKINDSVELKKKPNPDPLIVGVKDGRYWLLTKFDVTPLENLIATEFSE